MISNNLPVGDTGCLFLKLPVCQINSPPKFLAIQYKAAAANLEGDPRVQRNPLLLVLCRILGSFKPEIGMVAINQGHGVHLTSYFRTPLWVILDPPLGRTTALEEAKVKKYWYIDSGYPYHSVMNTIRSGDQVVSRL